jgi:hypothetical protein
LKNILISLGTLNSLEYKYFDRGRVIRVNKGSLVVMKGNKIDGLYFLQGTMVINSIVVSSSNDPDSNTTRLWHVQLSQMNERGMRILSKRDFFVTRKQDHLTFMSIVCSRSSEESSSIQVSTKQLVKWIISIYIFEVPDECQILCIWTP